MIYCDVCGSGDHTTYMHHARGLGNKATYDMTASDEALAKLRAKLTGESEYVEGKGNVIFTRHDGQTVQINGVAIDSIGDNLSKMNVISVELFDSNDIIHVPYVACWTFSK